MIFQFSGGGTFTKKENAVLRGFQLKKVTEEKKNLLYDQRETLTERLPYRAERRVLGYIRDGDIQKLRAFFLNAAENGLYVGNLSDDTLRQEKYLAVSFVTLASRAVVEGGMPETEAYCLSDEVIQKVDRAASMPEVRMITYRAMLRFAQRARENRRGGRVDSAAVRVCVSYIDAHLHYRISLSDLSQVCGLSSSRLSRLFQLETGMPPGEFIMARKLREARNLLLDGGLDSSAVANVLGFCSQSYFISCFKKEYGVTPAAFARTRR